MGQSSVLPKRNRKELNQVKEKANLCHHHAARSSALWIFSWLFCSVSSGAILLNPNFSVLEINPDHLIWVKKIFSKSRRSRWILWWRIRRNRLRINEGQIRSCILEEYFTSFCNGTQHTSKNSEVILKITIQKQKFVSQYSSSKNHCMFSWETLRWLH